MSVAPRPETRTVSVKLTGRYAGWEVTARADFRAGFLADLQSGQVAKVITVLDEIVIEHNFPNGAGELAASFADVDPYGGVIAAGIGIFEAIGKLPNG
jgi:hypothetical protein